MRNLPLLSQVMLLPAGTPQFARAEAAPATPAGDSPRTLLDRLDLHFVARAHAAECKDEGEACKTNAECCSGLECSGDPEPTCQQPE
jgi:hypothetical protein